MHASPDPRPPEKEEEALRPLYFHDLGTDPALLCPDCSAPLGVIEFETNPPTRIERCTACEGFFFDPGELEVLLDTHTTPLVWLDPDHVEIVPRAGPATAPPFYKKCPVCSERMVQSNFGGRSSVLLDHCHVHGDWVEGGEMRRLRDWWIAGGKRIHRQYEAARRANAPPLSACELIFKESPTLGKKPDLTLLVHTLVTWRLRG